MQEQKWASAPKRQPANQKRAQPSKRGRKSKKQRRAHDDSDDEEEYQPTYAHRKASSQQAVVGERRTARRAAAPKRYSPPPPEPARPRRKRLKIEHDAVCYACKESLAGILENTITCSVCPRAYHAKSECSGMSEIPKGTWYCPWCVRRNRSLVCCLYGILHGIQCDIDVAVAIAFLVDRHACWECDRKSTAYVLSLAPLNLVLWTPSFVRLVRRCSRISIQ